MADHPAPEFASPELAVAATLETVQKQEILCRLFGVASVLLRRLELTSVFLVAFLHEKNSIQVAPLPWWETVPGVLCSVLSVSSTFFPWGL